MDMSVKTAVTHSAICNGKDIGCLNSNCPSTACSEVCSGLLAIFVHSHLYVIVLLCLSLAVYIQYSISRGFTRGKNGRGLNVRQSV